MSKKIVKRNLDLTKLPALTRKQKAELAALESRPDSAIDYTDIAPLTDEFFEHAVRGRFYRPIKQSTTVRIDADVLAWLRAQGKGYQSRINAILRREMLAAVNARVRPESAERSPKWPVMVRDASKSIESIRKEVHSALASLTPREANVLRARYGLPKMDATEEDDDEALHAIARNLAMLKKAKKRG